MRKNEVFTEHLRFTGRNVPIVEIARATGKDPQYLRIGLQKGILRFGYAFKKDNSGEYNYFCPDKKVYDELGYFNEKVGCENDK